MPLVEDLQSSVPNLDAFHDLTIRILNYLPEVAQPLFKSRGYTVLASITGSSERIARPYNESLFVADPKLFDEHYVIFRDSLDLLSRQKPVNQVTASYAIDRCTYTIQQSLGIALDLLGNPNAARKHVGNRFEELIRQVVQAIGLSNKKLVLKIPYGGGTYSCETDMVFTTASRVQSTSETVHPDEVVVSLKTTSKDRMSKIFNDKMLMERFVGHPIKMVGIFLNDIQRKDRAGIAYTFVGGLFMVYTKFMTTLDGVYFVDPPPQVHQEPYQGLVAPFSTFVLRDARSLADSAS